MINKIKILAFIIIAGQLAFGQNKLPKNHSMTNLTCKTCHSCEVPTKKDPCLNACPRAEMVTVKQSPSDAPEVEILKELSKTYMPVVFSHRVHAQMSEMSGGCETCHHYNTLGPIQPCINCHQTKRSRNDVTRPDLEAAYHQQCINCHREWSHTIDCTSCHALKTDKTEAAVKSSVAKLTGKSHPKIEEPKKIIFETDYKQGKIVTFFHDEHISVFGAKCINCHQQENCTKCHDKGETAAAKTSGDNMIVKIKKSPAQHHQPCFSCHQDDKCTTCHKQTESGPFDHAQNTGWALNRFHQKLSCSKCHGTSGKFVKLNPECTSCHSNFEQGKFEHSVTGLKLDETHSAFECAECHQKRDFSKPPSCAGCHDDKSYPKNKPGKMASIK